MNGGVLLLVGWNLSRSTTPWGGHAACDFGSERKKTARPRVNRSGAGMVRCRLPVGVLLAESIQSVAQLSHPALVQQADARQKVYEALDHPTAGDSIYGS